MRHRQGTATDVPIDWTAWAYSPQCPWCGDEITDSPDEDIPSGRAVIECGGCGEQCEVETEVSVRRRARRDGRSARQRMEDRDMTTTETTDRDRARELGREYIERELDALTDETIGVSEKPADRTAIEDALCAAGLDPLHGLVAEAWLAAEERRIEWIDERKMALLYDATRSDELDATDEERDGLRELIEVEVTPDYLSDSTEVGALKFVRGLLEQMRRTAEDEAHDAERGEDA